MRIIHFYHFDSDPRFLPFLLYVRWKSGVTFVRSCFRDEGYEDVDVVLILCFRGLSVLDIMRLASPADFLKERNNRIAAHLKVIAKTVAEQTVKGSKAIAGGLRAGLKVRMNGFLLLSLVYHNTPM